MQTRSYKKSKLIRRGPYLQTEITIQYSFIKKADKTQREYRNASIKQ